MLRQLDSSLWVDEVSFSLFGVNFGNRMTCIQLSDNSFWIHSPTKFKQTTYEKIKAKGKIKYLITPNRVHNLFVMDWKSQAADALLLAPANTKKIHEDLTFEETPEEKIAELFDGEITCIPINGIPMLKEYAFIHHPSKTLILTDIAFNFGSDSRGWSTFFLRLYGAYNKFGPSISIRAIIKDKVILSASLNKIISHDFDRIIVSHGDIVENNGKKMFKDAFNKYL